MSDLKALAALVEQFRRYPDNELLDMAGSPNWALSTHQAVREVLEARGVAVPPLPPAPPNGWADPVYPPIEAGAEPAPAAARTAAGSGSGRSSAVGLAGRPRAGVSQPLRAEELSPETSKTNEREGEEAIGPRFWIDCSAQYLCDRFPPTLGAAEDACVREIVPSWNPGGAAGKKSASTSTNPELVGQVDPGPLLRDASEAVSQGERGGLERARSTLLALLAVRPDLVEARELLGLAQLRLREFKDAIETHAALAKAAPDLALHQLRWGLALHGDEQLEEAATHYRRAMKLAPADLETRLAWVDLQVDLERYDQALTALGEAAKHCSGSDRSPELRRRRLEILLASDKLEEAWAELDRIRSALAGKDTTALHAWSSALKAALPAKLLARGCAAQTNELLQRLQWLGGREAPPSSVGQSLKISTLPRATRDWLASRREAVQVSNGDRIRVAPALLIPLVFLGFALLWTFAGDERWEVGGIIATCALFGATALVTVVFARQAWRVIGSRYGSFTVLHPLYLIRGSLDRVSLWPCVNFRGALVQGVGFGPQSSIAELQFADGGPRSAGARVLSASGSESLVRVMAIDLLRRWALGRIAAGSLEKEEVARQFPVELIHQGRASPAPNPLWSWWALAWYCGALALVAPLVPLAVRHNGAMADERERVLAAEQAAEREERRAADEQRWRDLQAHPTLKSKRAYLDQADAPHRADAPALVEELKRQLEKQLATRPTKGRAVLQSIVNAILDGAPAKICLDVRMEDEQAEPKEHGEALRAFARAIRHGGGPLKVFQAAVDETFGQDQIDVGRCHGARVVTVALSAQALPIGETYGVEARDGVELPAMAVDWSAAVRLPGSKEPAARVGGLLEPPRQIQVRLLYRVLEELHQRQPTLMREEEYRAAAATAKEASREMAHMWMAEQMARQTVRAAAVDLGLGRPPISMEEPGAPEEVYRLTRSLSKTQGEGR